MANDGHTTVKSDKCIRSSRQCEKLNSTFSDDVNCNLRSKYGIDYCSSASRQLFCASMCLCRKTVKGCVMDLCFACILTYPIKF